MVVYALLERSRLALDFLFYSSGVMNVYICCNRIEGKEIEFPLPLMKPSCKHRQLSTILFLRSLC
jgi:hypothetical protein